MGWPMESEGRTVGSVWLLKFGDPSPGVLTWKDLAAGLFDGAHVQTAVIETGRGCRRSTTREMGHIG
jgi:hypothetical protein